MVPSRSFAGSG